MSFRGVLMLGMVGLMAACATPGPSRDGQPPQAPAAAPSPSTAAEPAPQEVPDVQAAEPVTEAAVTPPAAEPTQSAEDRARAERLARATPQYRAALAAMRAGHDAEAEQRLQQMTLDFPELAGPYTNLGILHYRAGKLNTAKADFSKALSLNPRNAASLNHLGIISREEGRFQEAYTYYQQAIAIAPDYANAHLNLGILLDLYLGNLDEALVHYKQYQALTEDVDETVRNWIVDLSRRVDKP